MQYTDFSEAAPIWALAIFHIYAFSVLLHWVTCCPAILSSQQVWAGQSYNLNRSRILDAPDCPCVSLHFHHVVLSIGGVLLSSSSPLLDFCRKTQPHICISAWNRIIRNRMADSSWNPFAGQSWPRQLFGCFTPCCQPSIADNNSLDILPYLGQLIWNYEKLVLTKPSSSSVSTIQIVQKSTQRLMAFVFLSIPYI